MERKIEISELSQITALLESQLIKDTNTGSDKIVISWMRNGHDDSACSTDIGDKAEVTHHVEHNVMEAVDT